MLIAPAQGVGKFEEGESVGVYGGVYAGARGKVLEMRHSKVCLKLYPYTGKDPCPYHVPYYCLESNHPHIVHIFKTSLNAPPAPPEMEPSLSEGDCIEMWLGCYEEMRGLVVKVTEKMVKVKFDLTNLDVWVWKTSIVVLEEEDDSLVGHPTLNVPSAASLGTRASKDELGRLPVAHLVSP
jgi:hypothetical protein